MDDQQLTYHTYNQIAELYQDKFMNLNLYDDTYDRFCELIPQKNARIFEIACGPGNITKYLLTKRPDFKIGAIDFAENMIQLAKMNNPSASFEVMDCRKIDTINSKYEAIICGFCMPYLSKNECAKLIKDCARLLGKGGIFYLSVIEGNYEDSAYETSSDGRFKMFIYNHEADFLFRELQNNQFEILEVFRKIYPKNEESTTSHLIIVASLT